MLYTQNYLQNLIKMPDQPNLLLQSTCYTSEEPLSQVGFICLLQDHWNEMMRLPYGIENVFTLGSNFNCCTAPGKSLSIDFTPVIIIKKCSPGEYRCFSRMWQQGPNFANLPILGSCTYSQS